MFALNNDQSLVVDYLLGETEMSISSLVFWSALIGLLLGVFAMSFGLVKTRMQLKRTQKKLNKAQQELQNLRTLPVQDPVYKDKA